MKPRLVARLLFAVQLALQLSWTRAFVCHPGCHCIWRHGKMTATCTELGLETLPTDLDEGLQVLNMSLNNLKALQNNQVASAGLVNLQKFYLAQNQLRELQESAFYKMNNLVELDLSYNKLGAVPTNAFKHLNNLRQLLLKGNPITVLEDFSFSHLRSLSVLELSSCKIETVARDAFAHLENLQVLKLDNNLIGFIDAHTMQPLTKLHGISLDGNAWNCDCRLRPFRDWLTQHHPTSYSPTCHLPETIRDLAWSKTPDLVFSCSPNLTSSGQEFRVQAGSNVTLYCEAWGVPAPQIQWFAGEFQQDGLIIAMNESLTTSQLVLNDVAHSGPYTCRATNSAGSSQLNFSVTVSSDARDIHTAPTTTKGGIRIPEGHYTGNAGLIGLILGITTASLVILSVAVLLMWSCRRGGLSDKRKNTDATTALGIAEVEPLKAAEAAEDLPPQKPPRSHADYECLTPAALDTTLRTSSLYSANPYCCRDRRSVASCGPIPVPMPLLPTCATLPRRPLSLSPAEFSGGQMVTPPPRDFSSLRASFGDSGDHLRSLDLCAPNVMATRGPDVIGGPQQSVTPSGETQDGSLSQSSSTAPLLASPDLIVDQGDHPSAYFRSPSVLSTVPEAQEMTLDGTQV